MTDTDKTTHVIVHLKDLHDGSVSPFPATLSAGETKEVAAERVKTEQQDIQNKFFMVDDIEMSPRKGRHKEVKA